MSQYIILARGNGKSLRACHDAVELCAGTQQVVAVFGEGHKKRLMEEALRQGVEIPTPIVVGLNKPRKGFTYAGIIVDRHRDEEVNP